MEDNYSFRNNPGERFPNMFQRLNSRNDWTTIYLSISKPFLRGRPTIDIDFNNFKNLKALHIEGFIINKNAISFNECKELISLYLIKS